MEDGQRNDPAIAKSRTPLVPAPRRCRTVDAQELQLDLTQELDPLCSCCKTCSRRSPGALMTRIPRVVIVGAGFGGLEAAKRLAGRPVDVTVVDRRNHHLFQPLLYQVATAALSTADIAAPLRSILAGANNVRVLLDTVCSVVPPASAVHLASGRLLPYDWLILATG